MKKTGELVAVDTFFAGTLKGVGKVYSQTVLDCFSRHAWPRLYTLKVPATAAQILNNGREFCGREDQHPYELFLQLEKTEHRRTQVGPPSRTGTSNASTARSSTST